MAREAAAAPDLAALARSVDGAPWLSAAREQLVATVRQDRVPHALLIRTLPGAGGEQLALWMARLLLGVAAPHEERHPDFTRIGLVEESRQIRIEQVR